MKWIKKTNIRKVHWEESLEKDFKLRVLKDLENKIFCYIFKDKKLIHKEIIDSSIPDAKKIVEDKFKELTSAK